MLIYQIWKIYQLHIHLHVPHVPARVYQQPPKSFVQLKNELHWMKQLEQQMRWKAVKPQLMAGCMTLRRDLGYTRNYGQNV